MTSFFPFSSTSSSASTSTSTSTTTQAPHLEITITPSSSAFYAGEPFSAKIRFTNTGRSTTHPPDNHHANHVASNPAATPQTAASAARPHPPHVPRPSGSATDTGLPRRQRQIGRHVPDTPFQPWLADEPHSQAGPSRLPLSVSTSTAQSAPLDGSYGYDSGGLSSAVDGTGQSRDDLGIIRSPDSFRYDALGGLRKGKGKGHERRTQSLALGQSVSPQEMVWALSGGPPPPLPNRRPQSTAIPRAHPHSRQISISTAQALSSPPTTISHLPPISDNSISHNDHVPTAAQPRPPLSRLESASSTSSSAQGYVDMSSDQPSLPTLGQTRSNGTGRATSYPHLTNPPQPSHIPAPPSHPLSRTAKQVSSTCTILWAYTRLVATFHPSNHYIPPDPLLPLRSMLLHQPVGSGSLGGGGGSGGGTYSSRPGDLLQKPKSNSSRWQLSFGTGTLSGQSAPSLTGSLVGLANSLISGGSGGSLEEERKRVWNMKDLPVLETARSLIGVEVKLGEGEEKEYEYTLDVPMGMPPSHRGKAWRFEWKMILSVGVMLGKEQRVHDVELPVRVWPRVSVDQSVPLYDVLRPIIQTKDEGTVTETPHGSPDQLGNGIAVPIQARTPTISSSKASLQQYASHLLDTLPSISSAASTDAKATPSSPDKTASAASPVKSKREETGKSTSSLVVPLSPPHARSRSPSLSRSRSIENGVDSDTISIRSVTSVKNLNGSPKRKTRRASYSYVVGDEDLVEHSSGGAGGSAEAVELLSRHSAKSSFDIAKDGHLVAVLTLTKTTFRLGETVLGVVDINRPHPHPSDADVYASTGPNLESDLQSRPANDGGVVPGERKVLKVSAFLESHDYISSPLLPLSPRGGRSEQPKLVRTHAEFALGYTTYHGRVAFELDVPGDGTPSFGFKADGDDESDAGGGRRGLKGGQEVMDDDGGVRWFVKLAFLVASPAPIVDRYPGSDSKEGMTIGDRKRSATSKSTKKRTGTRTRTRTMEDVRAQSVFPTGNDGDNAFFAASETLAPVLPVIERVSVAKELDRTGRGGGTKAEKGDVEDGVGNREEDEEEEEEERIEVVGYEDMKVDMVECEIPVRVLPGNTAFEVKPVVRVL